MAKIPSRNIHGTHGYPKHWSSHEAYLPLAKMDLLPAFCWQRVAGESKHTLSPLYFYSSNKPSWLQRFGMPAKGNVYVRVTALVQNKSEPRRGNENLLHLYAPLQAVLLPLLQSSPWISSYSHKGEGFHS